MPKSTHKKVSSQPAIESAMTALPDPHRAGLPAADSIISVTVPTAPMALAPGGAAVKQYTIIHTNEIDEYEEALAPSAALAPASDDFEGKDRKAAKLSISNAKTEKFKDVRDLISSLAPEATMKNHKPKIGKTQTSKRVKEEERNIRVRAFLYAAKREDDNDFHLILGRDPKSSPEMYMTMELSGLPPANSPAFKQLNAARDAFKKFYNDHAGGQLPGKGGYDFPDPPVPVEIDGSLFFDVTHSTGPRPGPKSLKSRMPVIWEVHPIAKIKFKS
ncbi:MAG: hypothetical protein ACREA9_21690 [Pyrinomonadaceae bacterium]